MKSGIKVVVLSTAVSYAGGAIMTLLDVVPHLQKKGVEFHFILKGHGPLEKILREKNIPCNVIKSYDWCIPEVKIQGLKSRIAWAIKSVVNLLAEIQTSRLLKEIKPDVYHLNCIYNGTGALAARFLKVPIVWHLREFVHISGETTMFVNEKKAWKKINLADRIICVSEYLRDFYSAKIDNKEKSVIVYDGIDMSRFDSPEKCVQNDKKVIIGLSGTATVKNHIDAIDALGILKQKGYQFTLLIPGKWSSDSYNQKYKNMLQQKIMENSLKYDVELIGMQEDMNAFWKRCDISLVCSKRESFGLAATEAMACGVPLICSNTSISGELTNQGKNVFTYKTGNAEELEKRIETCIAMLGTSELLEKTRNAEQYVREHFAIEKSATDLLRIYQEMV